MAARKIQAEIERTLKKVAEGVEVFESIFEKIQQAANATQKEKLEGDLKKEIKKLQRYRDQIKSWISSSEIKDKKALLENRKLIEQEMEKFKACEKELKTKAFSKEGLMQASKIDPAEKEKAELANWVTETVDKLSTQVDAFEAEQEVLQAALKKARKTDSSKASRLTQIESQVERHKHHIVKLEIILRMLENGNLTVDQVKSIKDDVNYYVDSHQDDDFNEDEGIYDDLNLDEAEAYGFANEDDGSGTDNESSEEPRDSKTDRALSPKTDTKRGSVDVESSPSKPSRTSTTAKPGSNPSLTDRLKAAPAIPKSPLKTATASASPSRNNSISGPSSTASTSLRNSVAEPTPAPVPVQPMVQKYAAAAAAAVPVESKEESKRSFAKTLSTTDVSKDSPSSTPDSSALPRPEVAQPAASILGNQSHAEPTSLQSASSVTSATSALTKGITPPHDPSLSHPQQHTATATTIRNQPLQQAPLNLPVQQQLPHQQQQIPLQTQMPQLAAQFLTSPQANAVQSSSESASSESIDNRLPPSVSDLVSSFEAARERSTRQRDEAYITQMLDTSAQFVPDILDSERPKYYLPKAPHPVPGYYPQVPLAVFESPQLFDKFDIDTLFFIFYYQQGTFQQYLAARELKKQSWRFHKKYLTWFQRHEEPKAITDEYEQGTYIYFDYEGAWCQRKKSEFRFEYQWLED